MSNDSTVLPVSPASQDTWETRIEQAAKVMGLEPKRVEEILATKGFEITKDPCGLEMLADEQVTPFGDLRKLFCDDSAVAVPKLRMALKYLRGSTAATPAAKTDTVDPDMMELQRRYGINIKVRLDELGAEELIPLYKPTKVNRISEALKKKYGTKAVIAFKPDADVVAVEETINYLADLDQGFKEEDAIEVDGELVKLYPVGVVPNQLVDEDPLFAGVPLKRERSTVNRVNWTGFPLLFRQLVRILVDNNKIDPNNKMNVMQHLKLDMEDLKKLYPETYMLFKELSKKGELPKLHLSMNEAATKKNNPFGTNRSY